MGEGLLDIPASGTWEEEEGGTGGHGLGPYKTGWSCCLLWASFWGWGLLLSPACQTACPATLEAPPPCWLEPGWEKPLT